MKKSLLFALTVFFYFQGFSQLLSWTPDFPLETTSSFTITVDANYGNKGLLNHSATDVYVHIGVITSKSTSSGDWRYVTTTWGTTTPSAKATSLGNNKWSFTISGGLRTYFGMTDPTEAIRKIAILFRSGDGNSKQANADGGDMFIPVYTSGLDIRITTPFFQPTFVPVPEPLSKNVNDVLPVTAVSSSPATLTISFNGSVIQTAANAQTISASPVIVVPGSQQVIVKADNGTTTSSDTLSFFVSGTVSVAPLPAGARQGINYAPDNQSVTLVLYAPGKTRVSVIGEFTGSNWIEQSQYEMTNTPDGDYWWITLSGLTPGVEYGYQYLVDGTLKIADPYAEKILDPSNDGFISSTTYPGLKAYPAGLTTGIVSVLQTAQAAYNWQVPSFTRPDKRNLVIYELLLRDFVAAHDWKTLTDTLNYFKSLGVNAIEVMPFNEFEGNLSWGYNPDFYFAPDKYYGPAATLKAFIDKCHQNGIAVIMDIALNHSFGSSPMVQLYWDAVNNRPSSSNPWFNPVAKHAFNVGYDMNHESLATRYFVSRVVDHWLTDYKIDGFRFDLSKGFTQTQTCDNNGANCDVAAWGNYDASRVAIWKRYYDTLQEKSPGSYCILEHFADNSEETELSAYGMMLWGNENYNYNQASMGYSTDWNFSYGIANQRGWTNPYLDTYMESHDEERLMFKNINYGNSSGGYNIKDTATALKRQELAAAFFFTIPGPKMLWQFGEMGYDYSINYCGDGTINANCRTDAKPIRWDYLQQTNRKELFDVYSALIKLRFNSSFSDQFTSNTTQQDLTGAFKSITLSKIVVVGNFDVVSQTGSVTFPATGTWYDYLNGTTITAGAGPYSFTLQPGEYHVYTRINAALPVTIVNFTGKKVNNVNILQWQVAGEFNLGHYELQRSADGRNFDFVAAIPADGSKDYQYTDVSPGVSPVQYYRLKSVDRDGNFSYSPVITIRSSVGSWRAMVSPNPAVRSIQLHIESPVQDKATVILTDLSGRQLYSRNIAIAAGANAYEISGAASFSAGTYLLTIHASGQTQSIKVIKR